MPRSSSRPSPPAIRLSRAQADDVLRYWLASLRLEEALQARPSARQGAASAAVPRLEQPTPGQDYFKVPLDAALASLLAKQGQVTRAFDAELCGFFESWLYRQYRRSEDESELSHLLCFPVVHLPRGELAGLLRCPVRLRFGSGSASFSAPTRAERQRGSYPAPPDQARLTRGAQTDGAWPFFVDTRLLRQPLGVPVERIDALFEALRSFEAVAEPTMLALLTLLLEGLEQGAPSEPETALAQSQQLKAAAMKEHVDVAGWLTRLTEAVRRLLAKNGSRARAYPVGIVVDGTQAKTTWHLQRELEALIEGDRARWKVESPLGAYLTGKPRPAGKEPQRALFPGPALTASQRAAAETFWGSSFSAVQGPPGTGKTRLILHLCAEHLVRQVEALLGAGRASPGLFLITSSNNRAVDNVIEPLSAGEGLPLALRVGSRQVCEHQLLAQLRRTLAWLKRAELAPEAERHEQLTRAKAALRAPGEALERLVAPRREALARAGQRARLEQELIECALDSAEATGSLGKAHAHVLLFTAESLKNRLLALSALCEAPASADSLRKLERHFQRTSKRQLAAFQDAVHTAQLACELPLPPALPTSADLEQQLEAWEEATEVALSRLAELRAGIERNLSAAAQAERARRLRGELESLNAEGPAAAAALDNDDELSFQLFRAAVAAREAWAGDRAAELITAVSAAIRVVEQERSLRPLFRSDPDAARLLGRLFGIWGSTLLSLGNCWPADLGGVARVVIDEAGQCHPAHAVSALLRAESALVIGDVHQLTPVIDLGPDDEARLLRACRLGTPVDLLEPYRVHADAEISSQSLADRAVSARGTLTDHFRCQREIIALSNEWCAYGLTVHTPPASRVREARYLTRPVSLVDLRGQQAPLAGSWCNELELAETFALLESLLDGGVGIEDIAVITPYRGQLERLRRGLGERRIPVENSQELAESGGLGPARSGLALGTVHRFQGGERSIVLFSSVVTHPASLGFLNARPNLLNVAVSRAQHHFICLGHAPVLAQGSRSRLLTDAAAALLPSAYGGGSREERELFATRQV